ncbi:MAG: CHAT domain-containing protein, partial [Burkholderiaceae bacterium]
GPNLNFSTLAGEEPAEDPQAAEKGELALALNLQANMALRVESLGLADAAASEALQILNTTRGLPRWWKADVLLTLGRVSSANGRLSAAERYFNTALAERRLVAGDGPQTIQILAAQAQAYQREGMNTSAIITYRDIFKLIKALPATTEGLISKEDLVPFGLAITGYAETLTDDGQKQGLYAEAFDAFQLIRPSVVEQTVNRASARLAVDAPGLAPLIDALQNAERARDAANLELSFETSLPENQRSRIAEDRLVAAKRQADAELVRLQAQITQNYPQYLRLATPKPLDLLALRQRLAAREAVVSFLIGEQVSFVQLVRREGAFIARVAATTQDLSESVASLRRALEIQAGSVNDFDLGLAHQVYQQLLGPVAAQLKDIDHLVVVPAGPLASLPFALLVESAPVGQASPAAYSKANWLARRMAISHMPSLRSFFALRTTAPAQAPTRGLLAFGDPVLIGQSPTASRGTQPVAASAAASQVPQPMAAPSAAGRALPEGLSALATSCRSAGPAPADLLRALAPLPDTADELRAVGKIFSTAGRNAQVFLGQEATESRLRSESLQDYRVLYFATHGLLPGELKCQAEPGLVLTPPKQAAASRAEDGLLEASEIASLRLNADLVVLSACNTAGSAGRFGGDALSGLAESFFYAGARGMVVSHWQVPSAATASLMTGLFQTLGPDLKAGAAVSLQTAQQALIARPETAHPFFWGAFVLVGDGLAEGRLPMPRRL